MEDDEMEIEEDEEVEENEERSGVFNNLKRFLSLQPPSIMGFLVPDLPPRTTLSRLLQSREVYTMMFLLLFFKEELVRMVKKLYRFCKELVEKFCRFLEDINAKRELKEWNMRTHASQMGLREFIDQNSSIFQECLKRGIPSTERARVWTILLGSDIVAEQYPEFQLVLQRDYTLENFWKFFFIGPDIQQRVTPEALSTVVQSYISVTNDHGMWEPYSGFEYVIIVLVLVMPTLRDACFAFVSIMAWNDYNRAAMGLYYHHMYPMEFLLRRFDFLVQVHMPKLGAHLGKSGSCNWLYAEDWFRSAFAEFPYPLAVRIWDVFLYQGQDFLLKFGLALMSLQEKKLLTLNTTELAQSLESYHILFRKPMLKKGPDRLIHLADSFDLHPV